MKQIIFISMLLFMGLTGCDAQKSGKDNQNEKKSDRPDVDIKVNREYDEDGNLIRYDSTYTYVYSNIDGDIQLRDSVFSEFMAHFNKQFGFKDDPFFNDLFFTDSLLQYDFYKKDFFHDRFSDNLEWIDKMMKEMDSIKNEFYNDRFKNEQESKE
jgi:hypothetical protein